MNGISPKEKMAHEICPCSGWKFLRNSKYFYVKMKNNLTTILAVMFVLLVCVSYLENMKIRYFSRYYPSGELRDSYSSDRPIQGSKQGYDTGGSVTTIHTGQRSKAKTRTQGLHSCTNVSIFRSIRENIHWKTKLADRFRELNSDFSSGWLFNDVQEFPWWQRQLMRKQRYIVASSFQPIISEMEYKILLGSFYTMAEALTEANITFFLYGGSHLGVYRHHGLVPWDDDIDVMLNTSDKVRLQAILSKVPYYSLHSPPGQQWKFFETSLTTITHQPYRWPFVDIFFFAENRTHVWDELASYRNDFCFRKKDIFPLQFRPFEGGMVPIPRHSNRILARNYHIDMCKANNYWHKFESYAPRSKRKNIRCSLLFKMFPFVFRTAIGPNCVEERLRKGNKTWYLNKFAQL